MDAPHDAEQVYRNHVARVCDKPMLIGIPGHDEGLGRITLDSVFVRLDVTTRRAPAPDDGEGGREHDGDDEYSRQSERETDANRTETLDVATALARGGRLVLRAEPGAGKTTLLRWLAYVHAKGTQAEAENLGPAFAEPRLPVYVELNKLAEWAKNRNTTDLPALLPPYIASLGEFSGTDEGLIADALAAGRCLLLLDGLDEIGKGARDTLCSGIDGMLRRTEGSYSANLVVAAGRPHAVTETTLSEDFILCAIRPFDTDEIGRFVRAWYAAAYPGSGNEADRLVAFLGAPANDGIARLARNPLLCSVLAIVFHRAGGREADVPRQRAPLYEACCRALIEHWEKTEPGRPRSALSDIGADRAMELLARFAFAAQRRGEGAGPGRALLIETMAADIELRDGMQSGEARQTAERLADALRQRAGVLDLRGDDTVDFVHPTFREHLAGRHIARLKGDDLIDEIMTRLYDPWWREALQLAVGTLGEADPGIAGRDFEDRADEIARLLGTVLDWHPRPAALAAGETRLSRTLLHFAPTWQMWRRQERWLLSDLTFALTALAEAASAARKEALLTRLDRLVRDALAAHLRGDKTVAAHRLADAAGRLDLKGARAALIAALDDEDEDVRQAVAEALAGFPDDDTRAALINALDDEDEDVRQTVAEALAGFPDDDTRAALINALADDDWSVRWAAAEALAGFPGDGTRAALINALADDNWIVREAAAGALAGFRDDDTRAALINALADDDVYVRPAAAAVLAGFRDDDARAALIAALENDDDWPVRRAAARALAGFRDDDARAALIAALENDDDWPVRRAAAEALAGFRDDDARAALIAALENEDDEDVRRAAARALAGFRDDDARAALIAALADDDEDVRRAAARALAGFRDDDARAALIDALDDDHEVVRTAAARALAGFPGDDTRAALIRTLGDDDEDVREAAAGALAGFPGDDTRAALIRALADGEWEVRAAAAGALAGFPGDDTRAALIRALADGEWEVRAAAAGALAAFPGDRWVRLAERRRRRAKWAIRLVVAGILLALLGLVTLPIVLFGPESSAAALAVSVILGLPGLTMAVVGMVLGFPVFRAMKREVAPRNPSL